MKLIMNLFKKKSKPIPLWVGQVWEKGDRNPFSGEDGFWVVTITDIQRGYVQFERKCGGPFKVDSMHEGSFRLIYKDLVEDSPERLNFEAIRESSEG